MNEAPPTFKEESNTMRKMFSNPSIQIPRKADKFLRQTEFIDVWNNFPLYYLKDEIVPYKWQKKEVQVN
jgi:hypothetical protein